MRSHVRQGGRRDRSRSRDSPRRSRDRSRSRVLSLLASDRSRSRDRSWQARRELWEGVETVAVSQAPIVSEASAAVAPPVVGGTLAAFLPPVQDLARFFLSLAGSSSHPRERLLVLRARLLLHPKWGFSCALRLRVEEQPFLVLRRRLLLWRLDLLPHPLLCPVRPADGSVKKNSPARVGAAIACPAAGPSGRIRDDLGNAPLPRSLFSPTGGFLSVFFHGMEEPAGIPSVRCKTSLASIYGLMSETSPAFHLLTSPLLRSLLDDTNLALSKFLEDQAVHGFLSVPSLRHRRYYRTSSSSSFPGPYSVPLGVTSITLEKAREVKKRYVSSLETMLSGVCEVASWLDWWLSTCGGFREHLPVCADFERLILSGSRALEFLASQGVTALGNLALSRRDSLLADVCSTVPAEEVARLRYSAIPETVSLFPSSLLDSALSKMRAAA